MKPHYRLKVDGTILLKTHRALGGRWRKVGTLTCGNYYWTQEYWDKYEANFVQQHRP